MHALPVMPGQASAVHGLQPTVGRSKLQLDTKDAPVMRDGQTGDSGLARMKAQISESAVRTGRPAAPLNRRG